MKLLDAIDSLKVSTKGEPEKGNQTSEKQKPFSGSRLYSLAQKRSVQTASIRVFHIKQVALCGIISIL